jgi:hypothetical protein
MRYRPGSLPTASPGWHASSTLIEYLGGRAGIVVITLSASPRRLALAPSRCAGPRNNSRRSGRDERQAVFTPGCTTNSIRSGISSPGRFTGRDARSQGRIGAPSRHRSSLASGRAVRVDACCYSDDAESRLTGGPPVAKDQTQSCRPAGSNLGLAMYRIC